MYPYNSVIKRYVNLYFTIKTTVFLCLIRIDIRNTSTFYALMLFKFQ